MNIDASALRKLRLLTTTGLMFFGALLQAQPAAAQIRPAYTKNVDQPGRLPYEAYVAFSRFGCSANCTNFASLFGSTFLFDAPAVPAGKRLVLQWVSANIPGNNAFDQVALQSSRVFSAQHLKWSYAGPFFGEFPSSGVFGMSAGTFATYGPGESPHIFVFINSASNFDGSVTLAGYLIDAVN